MFGNFATRSAARCFHRMHRVSCPATFQVNVGQASPWDAHLCPQSWAVAVATAAVLSVNTARTAARSKRTYVLVGAAKPYRTPNGHALPVVVVPVVVVVVVVVDVMVWLHWWQFAWHTHGLPFSSSLPVQVSVPRHAATGACPRRSIIRVEASVVAFVGLQTTWPEGADAVSACMRARAREAVAAAAGWLAGPGPHAKGLARSPARKHAAPGAPWGWCGRRGRRGSGVCVRVGGVVVVVGARVRVRV